MPQLPLPSASSKPYIPPPPLSKAVSLNIPLAATTPRSPTASTALSASSLHLQPLSDRDLSPFAPPSSFSQVHSSSTHAGGVQPSASFFHPSRPQPYSRPGSAGSGSSSTDSSRKSNDGRGLEEARGYNSSTEYPRSQKTNPSAQAPPLPNRLAFNPSAPPREPPLWAVPVKDVVTGKWVRNYERHPSRNRFFFSGRMLTGGDSPWAFMASSILVLGIAGVWFGTTCVWWWRNASPAVAVVGGYLCLITISSMIVTATRDPGILPRNLDPDPPYPAESDGGVLAPMPRDLKVRADVVRVKYCPTCKTYRPPRSSHCKMCDNCVDGCDHHCQWVNNCVGRRNYTTFFAFLTFATTTLVLVICTSALHIYLLTRKDHINFVHALRKAPGSVVVFCLSISVVWPLGALLSYHMRLLLLNVTTIEQIRNQAHKSLIPGPPPPNPFSHGNWRRNLLAVLCRPLGRSYLDGHGVVTEDKREINPGLAAAENAK